MKILKRTLNGSKNVVKIENISRHFWKKTEYILKLLVKHKENFKKGTENIEKDGAFFILPGFVFHFQHFLTLLWVCYSFSKFSAVIYNIGETLKYLLYLCSRSLRRRKTQFLKKNFFGYTNTLFL